MNQYSTNVHFNGDVEDITHEESQPNLLNTLKRLRNTSLDLNAPSVWNLVLNLSLLLPLLLLLVDRTMCNAPLVEDSVIPPEPVDQKGVLDAVTEDQ
jgi:hypothetical protein